MKTWARIALTVLVVVVAALRLDLRGAVATAASAAVAPFALAVLAYVASQAVTALRWREVARAVGFTIAPWHAVRTYLVGAFFGLPVPTPIGGDATRVLLLGRTPPGRAWATFVTAFDRVFGLVTLTIVAAVAALVVRSRVPHSVTASVLATACAAVGTWTTLPWLDRHVRLPETVRRIAVTDLPRAFSSPAWHARLLAMSLGVHGLQIVAQVSLARAIGVRLDPAVAALCHGVVVILGSLPLTLGGFGLRESAYVWVLSGVGVGVDHCVALGLLWFSVGVLNAMAGGLAFVNEPAPPRAS
jgi:uncharacterized membrane protein YbhN (UPF0104 family)